MLPVQMRASSVSELFDCPARWEAKHLLDMRRPSSMPARLGTAVHHGTAVYDQARAVGRDVSLDDAAGETVDVFRNPDRECEPASASDLRNGERTALRLLSLYVSQVGSKRRYYSVEALCEALTVDVPEHDVSITLTGTLDRIRSELDGDVVRLGLSDIKTGARSVAAEGGASVTGHGLQLGVYELLAEQGIGVSLSLPAEIVGLKTTSSPQVGVGYVSDARRRIVGTPEQPGAIQQAAALFASGNFYGNPRSSLCSERYCPRHAVCPFRE